MIAKEITDQIRPGATVRVHETLKEKDKTRTSTFSGLVLARKHGSEPGATFTVRAIVAGEGVEKIYPIHSPMIARVEIINSPHKVHRAKLYYIRNLSKKQIRRKMGATS